MRKNNYTKQVNDFGFVKFNYYTEDIQEKIHKKLFDEAIQQAKDNYDIMPGDKYYEECGDVYYEPSTVIIFRRGDGNYIKKIELDLSPYWSNDYEYYARNKDFHDKLYDRDTLIGAKLYHVDHVRNICTLHNKYTEKKFDVDFDYVSGDIELDDNLKLKLDFSK